ncbi:MAG TPA: hypothetical protein VE225_00500 [Rubrobacteraceae bacterium]|nr:hypothetical protein [Rubrobacteraceae bacterium]
MLIHVFRREDVEMVLIGPRNVLEVLTSSDDVLVGFALAGEASARAVGHDHQRGLVP